MDEKVSAKFLGGDLFYSNNYLSLHTDLKLEDYESLK